MEDPLEKLGVAAEDLVESFSLASGPGGQHVNKVSTAVSLRHIPTNTVVHVQDHRSQAKNRLLARARLAERLIAQVEAARQARRDTQEKARRRNRKRPYGVQKEMVKKKRQRGQVKALRRQPGRED
ncbi:MAG: peptide chain release factor-like protein [Verrucomicrobiales bacterium]